MTALVLIIMFFGAIGMIWFFQEKVIFFPEKLGQDHRYEYQGAFEEMNFEVEKGVFINAIHFKTEKPKGVVLYAHGNAGSLRTWGSVYPLFLDRQYDLVIYDYRGYGKSGGRISEENLYHDVDFLYEELLKKFDESQLVVYGRSIGTGVAVHAASQLQPALLILESPYYNFPDLVRSFMPLIPSWLLRYKLRNDMMISNVKCPVLVFHGSNDEVVYYDSSLKLKKHFKSSDRLVTIEGGHHNDLANFEVYHEELTRALQ
jgi:hypothetical protein